MKYFVTMLLVALFGLWGADVLGDSGTGHVATATYGHYFIYSDGAVLVKNAESDRVSSDGDSGKYDMQMGGVQFCSAKSNMICMVGGMEEVFAVPRKTLAVDDKWMFDGALFVVLPCVTTAAPGDFPIDSNPMIKTRILGQEISFYVIAKMGADGKYPVHLFYFSPDRGLIGDADPAEGEPINAPLLQEAYGPGSKEFDSKISPAAILTDDELKKLLATPLMKRQPPQRHVE